MTVSLIEIYGNQTISFILIEIIYAKSDVPILFQEAYTNFYNTVLYR